MEDSMDASMNSNTSGLINGGHRVLETSQMEIEESLKTFKENQDSHQNQRNSLELEDSGVRGFMNGS